MMQQHEVRLSAIFKELEGVQHRCKSCLYFMPGLAGVRPCLRWAYRLSRASCGNCPPLILHANRAASLQGSNMTDRVLIWGSGSAPCWRVMIALEEKGLKYESKQIEFSSSKLMLVPDQ